MSLFTKFSILFVHVSTRLGIISGNLLTASKKDEIRKINKKNSTVRCFNLYPAIKIIIVDIMNINIAVEKLDGRINPTTNIIGSHINKNVLIRLRFLFFSLDKKFDK